MGKLVVKAQDNFKLSLSCAFATSLPHTICFLKGKCTYISVTYIFICMCVCIYVHMYVCLCVYIYIYIYMCVCVCVCVCIYIYIYMYTCIIGNNFIQVTFCITIYYFKLIFVLLSFSIPFLSFSFSWMPYSLEACIQVNGPIGSFNMNRHTLYTREVVLELSRYAPRAAFIPMQHEAPVW